MVGIEPDYTDRELETHSIITSKQVSEKPIGGVWWREDDVIDHWDDLQLRATAWNADGDAVDYQTGSVASMMLLSALVDAVEGRVGSIEGDILSSGTLAVETDNFVCGPRFRSKLIEPVLGRSLVCEYVVEQLPVLDD